MKQTTQKMEKYEQLAMVGEGSYGLVMKCRHRETDQIVAVKKFLETEEDAAVRRMALREIRMLKKLRHENLVTMIEVFRYRKRFYLVFEFLEGTVLDELEKMPGGLGDERSRERIFQVIRAVNFCHSNHIIHRDVKPENVLVSSLGVVKLCDFGFARLVSVNGDPCTEYVATRWYRAPELLVGEQQYGAPVDIWAIGCLFAEMVTGDPLFPGESDIDQLYLIVKMIGKPCIRHQHIISKNSHMRSVMKSAASDSNGLYKTFSNWSLLALEFLVSCMKMDPQYRPTADELLRHNYFTHDRFPQRFLPALREKVLAEFNENPLLRKYKADILMSTDRKEEIRQRRSLQGELPRWKISLTEGSIKRKFSCDTVSSCDNFSDKSLISLTKSGQKLSVMSQRSGQNFLKPKDKSKQSMNVTQKTSQTNLDYARQADLQKLEKSLESLAKLANKSENLRPISCEKVPSPVNLNPPTPPQFQSLQPNVLDYVKSPSILGQNTQNVLHPNVSNISFNLPKKSPNLLHQIHNSSIKGTFNQVPLLQPPRGQQFLKKLDRNVVLDTMFMNVEPVVVNQNQMLGPSWMNNPTNSSHRKKEYKKYDGFTLPDVPGATASPNKTKKNTPDYHQDPQTVTPRYIHSSTPHKTILTKFTNNHPFL